MAVMALPRRIESQEEINVNAIHCLREFRQDGHMTWHSDTRGWLVQPSKIVDVLSGHGYQEYKRETVRTRRHQQPAGGVWQGLNVETGSVASVVWVSHGMADGVTVFIDIDGESIVEGAKEG